VGLYQIFISGVPSSERWQTALLLYTVGISMKICIDLLKHILRERISSRGAVLQNIVKTIIIYNDALFSVVAWVGGFNILYAQFPDMIWHQMLSVFILSASSLIVLKAFKCTAGTPVAIFTDSLQSVFSPNSYFSDKKETSDNYSMILDTMFTYFVVHTLVICSWWSIWELENHYILLQCEMVIKDIKAWDSVIIAFILSILVFAVNGAVKRFYKNNGPCFKVSIVVNCMSLAAFLASLNFWRGVWSLQDFYFFPNMNNMENLLLSHVVGFVWTILAGTGMMLTQSSAKDAQTPEYNMCQYWSHVQEDDKEEDEESQPTEISPLVRNL